MRSKEQVIWDFVQQWLRKADVDIDAAKTLLKIKSKDYFACVFHSQQAAEKFLKAYLVRHQIEFRKTHDLEEILNLCKNKDKTLMTELRSCVWLTPYGAEFRYPSEYPEVDGKTAVRAFKETQKVKKAVMKRLKEYLSKGRPSE